MKLWLLRPAVPAMNRNPWASEYDCAYGFVVSAETEAEARRLAQAQGGDETGFPKGSRPTWKDAAYTTCDELTPGSEPGIVMRDFVAG